MNRQNEEQYENEDAFELDDVLVPDEEQTWAATQVYQQPYAQPYEQPYDQTYDQPYEQPYEQDEEQPYQDEYPEAYFEGYEEFYGEEYSEEHEAADHESKMRMAMGAFDLVTMCIGIVVCLVLVALIFALFNWVKTDILHSALLLQSGLQ